MANAFAKGRPLSHFTAAFSLTPTDAATPQPAMRAFSANVAGNVTFRCYDSAADVTLTVLAGVVYDIAPQYIRLTGTAATGLIGYN
jgi:hypothetical protein